MLRFAVLLNVANAIAIAPAAPAPPPQAILPAAPPV